VTVATTIGPTLASIVTPKGSEADRVAGAWWLMFGLAAFVYVVVAGLIVYSTVRGRRRGTQPSRLREDAFIWIGGVAAPVVILFVLAIVTVHTTEALRRPARDALEVDVAGEDWWWAVRYPGTDIVTANEIHLPVDRPVDLRLTSDNVIHSFWVPELAGKQDAIPGQPNHLRITPEAIGTYVARCAEYCGLQHAHMEVRVIVQTATEFGRWQARQEATRTEPVSDAATAGAAIFQRQACAGCHTVRGTSATGTLGPDLTDFGARETIGAGLLENDPRNLADWIRDAPSLKPGATMPSFHELTDRDVQSIVAYLESLR
jgi:cytochrome c oxidase subunit 2